MTKDTPSVRRMTENEAIFRRSNENVQKGIEELSELARQQGQPDLLPQEDFVLEFYCECSDENCCLRITMSTSDYGSIHRDRSSFVVLPGHEVKEVESVIETNESYYVVKKFLDPPEHPGTLHATAIKNV